MSDALPPQKDHWDKLAILLHPVGGLLTAIAVSSPPTGWSRMASLSQWSFCGGSASLIATLHPLEDQLAVHRFDHQAVLGGLLEHHHIERRALVLPGDGELALAGLLAAEPEGARLVGLRLHRFGPAGKLDRDVGKVLVAGAEIAGDLASREAGEGQQEHEHGGPSLGRVHGGIYHDIPPPPMWYIPAMLRGLLLRLLRGAAVVFGVVTLTFLLLHLAPGDPVARLLGPAASPEQITAARHGLGLDRPLPAQYADWLGRAVRGDFGASIAQGRPAAALLAEAWPATDRKSKRLNSRHGDI